MFVYYVWALHVCCMCVYTCKYWFPIIFHVMPDWYLNFIQWRDRKTCLRRIQRTVTNMALDLNDVVHATSTWLTLQLIAWRQFDLPQSQNYRGLALTQNQPTLEKKIEFQEFAGDPIGWTAFINKTNNLQFIGRLHYKLETYSEGIARGWSSQHHISQTSASIVTPSAGENMNYDWGEIEKPSSCRMPHYRGCMFVKKIGLLNTRPI